MGTGVHASRWVMITVILVQVRTKKRRTNNEEEEDYELKTKNEVQEN